MGAGLLPMRLCISESSLQRNKLFLKYLPFCFIVTLSFFKSDPVCCQLFFSAAAFLEHAFPEAHALFRLGQGDVGCEKGFLLLLQGLLQALTLFIACRCRKIREGSQCLLQAFRLRPCLREPAPLLSELLLGQRKAAPSFGHRSLRSFTARREGG